MQIYSLFCPLTKSIRYIGFTSKKNLSERYSEHLCPSSYRKSNRKNNWIKSLVKQGLTPIIEIIEEVDISNWQEREIYWVAQFKTWGFDLTNSTEGGEGALGYKQSEEHKEKIRRANTGKKQSKETLKKLSEIRKGRKPSKKSIEKRTESRRNNGKPWHSEETLAKMRVAQLGKPKSEEARRKLSITMTGRKIKYDDEGNRKRI